MALGDWRGRLAVAGIVATAGCGQWSGAPVRPTEAQALPLGPGPIVRVAGTEHVVGAPRLHANGRLVALAWVLEGKPGGAIRVSVSRDSGLTFDVPSTIGDLGTDAVSDGRLDVGVAGHAGEAPGRSRIWVRFEAAHGVSFAWESTDGGRAFSLVTPSDVPASAVPEPWTVQHIADRRLLLLPPPRLRAAGAKRAAYPDSAPAGSTPAIAVDEHGALALAWTEEHPPGRSVVLRRAWFAWDTFGGDVRPFDAPVVVAQNPAGATPLTLTRVPGGVIVVWAADEAGGRSLFARAVGLDMTCTQEQEGGRR